MKNVNMTDSLDKNADQPLSDHDLKRMKRTPRVKIIRRALGLSLMEFSGAFRIPADILASWESGETKPDQAAESYLTVIAKDPEAVKRALVAA